MNNNDLFMWVYAYCIVLCQVYTKYVYVNV